VPLLERDALGRWRPRDEAILERLLSTGYGIPFAPGRRAAQLHYVAESLNNGDLALACISLVRMQLPPLPSAGHALAMAMADGLVVKYNPDLEDEPRVPAGNPDGGQWTSGGAGGDAAHIEPAAARVDETQAKKERFVDAHLADAERIADQLGVPLENILGIAAVESGWGEARFATQGKNLFGIHYPAPFATGYLPARRGPARVATFASYADSLRSFATISGRIVRGVSDPSEFAAALQNSGKFGIDPDSGRPKPTYVGDVSATIRGLCSIIARRRA
jgi:mannosyl-glycoprotein endo-beta-N-acetylglucosaminidase